MKKVFFAMLLLGIINSTCLAGDIRNGNWWLELDRGQKLNYTTGFFDGMDLGRNFSIWRLDDKAKDNGCREAVVASYGKFIEGYLSNVTNGQITDGLNSFYEDYRNRKIPVYDAAWLVLRSISGESEEKLTKIIENFRRNNK